MTMPRYIDELYASEAFLLAFLEDLMVS